MTIDEIKKARTKAENEIRDILNELEKSTGSEVQFINKVDVEEESFHGKIRLSRRVNILLSIP